MPDDSILEKVLQSRQSQHIEQFHPEEILNALLSHLNAREQSVVRRRFSLTPEIHKRKETLESIGGGLQITRERVRQIEKESIYKLKEIHRQLGNASPLRIMEDVVENVLHTHGGLMEEEYLIEKLHEVTLLEGQYRNILLFLIVRLLDDKLERILENEHMHAGWRLPAGTLDDFHRIHDMLHQYIENENRLFRLDELMKYVCVQIDESHMVCGPINENILRSYLRLSRQIQQNVFEEWGLSLWPTVRPRHMNDKIYLVLKREAKPMHFRDIAKHINEASFDAKRAYPATIHNELILDPKYILVGKGIYALKEWGYSKGTVMEVIVEILAQHGPLIKEEIMNEVLKKRLVKKTTIQLALMNKQRLTRDAEGRYVLVL